MKKIKEYLLDLNEGLLDNVSRAKKGKVDHSMILNDWLKENCSGIYKFSISKNNEISLRDGKMIIKGYMGENLDILKFNKINGDLSIENCPNLTTIEGIWPDVECKGSISINNCPKLIKLGTLPPVIGGSLVISNNASLKDISNNGLNTYVKGNIYMIKNGKKFKEENIKKGFDTFCDIYCSQENQEVIVEAFSDPRLTVLADALSKAGKSFKDLIAHREHAWNWSKIDSSHIQEVTQPGAAEIRMASKALKDGAIIVVLNKDNKPEDIITSYGDKYKIYERYFRWSVTYGASYQKVMGIIKASPGFWIISDDNNELGTFDLRNSRSIAKRGMVINDKKYYEKVARENIERYKKILAQNAIDKNDSFDKVMKNVQTAFDKYTKVCNKTKNTDFYDAHKYNLLDISNDIAKLMSYFQSYMTCRTRIKKGSEHADRDRQNLEQAVDVIDDILNKLNNYYNSMGV